MGSVNRWGVEFSHFEQSQGAAAILGPSHAIALLPMGHHLIHTFLHPPGTNRVAGALSAFIVNDLTGVFLQITQQIAVRPAVANGKSR